MTGMELARRTEDCTNRQAFDQGNVWGCFSSQSFARIVCFKQNFYAELRVYGVFDFKLNFEKKLASLLPKKRGTRGTKTSRTFREMPRGCPSYYTKMHH